MTKESSNPQMLTVVHHCDSVSQGVRSSLPPGLLQVSAYPRVLLPILHKMAASFVSFGSQLPCHHLTEDFWIIHFSVTAFCSFPS